MSSQVLPMWREGDEAHSRPAELSALLRELEDARSSGKARFVFVRGPAGVGKSHLFGLFRQALARSGTVCFEAESARETRRPFGLFGSLLSEVLEHLGHLGASQPQLAALSSTLRPLWQAAVAPASAVEGRRLELCDAASEALAWVGRENPVFLFPDLDSADVASLELFRYVAAVASGPAADGGGLYVASFRDDVPLPAPLNDLLGKLSARMLSLRGLDVEGIRGYLSRNDVVQRLLDVTGGVPEALEELLSRSAEAPVDLFLRRLERLPAQTCALLPFFAVQDSALDASVLTRAHRELNPGSGEDAFAVASALDVLVRERVLVLKVHNGRPLYRFVREAEKQALAMTLQPAQRAPALRALGEALLAAGDVVGAAGLWLEVEPSGKGVQVALEAAGVLAQRGAHEESEALYRRALEQLDEAGKASVHAQLSELAAAQGDFLEALRALLRSRRGTGRSSSELHVRAAGHAVRVGRLSLAERLLRRSLRLGADSGALEAATALAELRLTRGDPAGAVSLARSSLDPMSASTAGRIALGNVLGRALLRLGQLEDAARAFAQNQAAAEAAGLRPQTAQAAVNQGIVAHLQQNRERAIRFYQSALVDADRPLKAKALANLGSIYAEAGEFEPAIDHLTRGVHAFSRLGQHREVAQFSSNLARVHHFVGDLARAQELGEYALRLAREMGEPYLTASALLTLGAVHLDRAEVHDAQRDFDEARGLFERAGSDGYAVLAVALKARAHLSAGERAQAQAELDRPMLDKAAASLPSSQVELELVRAELGCALGDLHGAGRAVGRVRDALLQSPELEGPYRTYFLMARLRQLAGDAAGAQTERSRAARLLDELIARVPPSRRTAFLSIPRRAEVLAAVEPELRLPRPLPVPTAPGLVGHGLVGRSAALVKVTRQLEPVARSNATVLIRGESGTGKELFAAAIHGLSPRKAAPFIKVNCAAMVEDLLLSELFGHEKGAFTGAVRERKGRFELAEGGTLFLDEIGDISPKCQVALLRVLQERELERVGGTKTIKVDVRVICATNRDLEELIAQGLFRQDLYYRLKGVMLELPSLRERPEDLPELCNHFLARVAQERNEAPKRLSAEALEVLGRHDWPGNVRELENVLGSAAIFADGPLITAECFSHLPELAVVARSPAPNTPAVMAAVPVVPTEAAALDFYGLARARGISLKELRHEVEQQCIKRALDEASGNISEAARLLKMKRSRLSQIVNSVPDSKAEGDDDGE
jgi:DNA-binding NtrC family response regulator/tetratricopeptide (TPR) repeat protein